MPNDIINNWRPEVRSLLNRFIAAGCELVSCSNGEGCDVRWSGKFNPFLVELCACDEAWLTVKVPSGKVKTLYLVFGNDPGELVSDYLVDPTLDAVTEAHYDAWEGKPQPKASRAAIAAAEAGVEAWHGITSPLATQLKSPESRITLDSNLYGCARVTLETTFLRTEEARRDELVAKLQETVDEFFGRVS